MHIGDLRGQVRRTFDNITKLLASEGATWHDIVRTTCYLRDIERDYQAFNEERSAFYKDAGTRSSACFHWHPGDFVPTGPDEWKLKRLRCSGRIRRRTNTMRLAFRCRYFRRSRVSGMVPDARPMRVRQERFGPPAPRSLKPYTGAPEDLRPFSKFTAPYHEYYQDLIEYNGAARDIPDPDLKDLSEIRIGFLAPLYDHPDQALGARMLNGANMAIDEANAGGGYGGKPFRLITHNDYDNWQNSTTATAGPSKDSAIWGAASNDAVRMIYDDKVWAMFGSISSESTHIALRLTLKAETPLVNSASTDPDHPGNHRFPGISPCFRTIASRATRWLATSTPNSD